MPTRKTIRKTPCPKSESCLKNRKTGNCNKPTPNKVPFKKLGYETLSEYKDTLPDADSHPVKYRLAMCADMKLAKRAPAFRNAADHIKARRRLHKRETGFKYDSDSTDSEYESRHRKKTTSPSTLAKYGFDDSSDSSSDSDFSLSDSDSDDDGEYKKKDCSNMGNKCYSTKTGKCMVPNSRTIWSNPRNQKHIGLTYSEFKDRLAGLSTADRNSTLCTLANRKRDGTFPCDLSAESINHITARLPGFIAGDKPCEALAKYVLQQIPDADARHISVDTNSGPIKPTLDGSIIVPVTYRGYSKRLLIISEKNLNESLDGKYVWKSGELNAGGKKLHVIITSRP